MTNRILVVVYRYPVGDGYVDGEEVFLFRQLPHQTESVLKALVDGWITEKEKDGWGGTFVVHGFTNIRQFGGKHHAHSHP